MPSDKLERFQLEDPRRYVLELLAAAASSGTERIDITNDSDDFIIAWKPEETLEPADLDTLFDHVFGQPDTARGATLQHLAIGVLAAHGLNPRWLRVDLGDETRSVRLEVNDPAATAHVPLDPPVEGLRIHVRERISTSTVREALRLAFEPPAETRLIAGAANRFPVPLFINGEQVETLQAPDTYIRHRRTEDGSAELWWIPEEEGIIDVRRHGLVVGHLHVAMGRTGFCGVLDADDLELNASRSAVVENERWKKHTARLKDELRELLRSEAPEDEPDRDVSLTWTSYSAQGKALPIAPPVRAPSRECQRVCRLPLGHA